MPMMEQNNAFDVLGPRASNTLTSVMTANVAANGTDPQTIVDEAFPGALCPSDSGADTNTNRAGLNPADATSGTALTNYVYANNARSVPGDTSMNAFCDPASNRAAGMFCDREQGLGQMTDGTSNVIMLSERRSNGDSASVTSGILPGAGLLYGVRGTVNDGVPSASTMVGIQDITFATSGGINDFTNAAVGQGVSSGHSGGVNIVLGDDSTHLDTNGRPSWPTVFYAQLSIPTLPAAPNS